MDAESATSWRDHAATRLRDAGHRRGGAREAVVELLSRQHCALSAQEIDDRLRGGDRAVGRASVYRALEQLAELKLLARVDVGDGVARYEPAMPGGGHHHHVVCERCGRLESFEDEELESAIRRLSGRLRFDVDEHDVTLRGACPRCR
jgi:Fur family transcriptional regulator, ferric uptake regulator